MKNGFQLKPFTYPSKLKATLIESKMNKLLSGWIKKHNQLRVNGFQLKSLPIISIKIKIRSADMFFNPKYRLKKSIEIKLLSSDCAVKIH